MKGQYKWLDNVSSREKRIECTVLAAKNNSVYVMQRCLEPLDIPLKVTWIPKADSAMHGEITSGKLLIYDADEEELWLTFQHEVYEYKLREVTCVYRELVNCLIECFERLAYEKKEEYINFLPNIAQIISKEKGSGER